MTESIIYLQFEVQSLREDLLKVQKQVRNISSLVTAISYKLSSYLGQEIVMDSMRLYSEIVVPRIAENDTLTTPSTESGETPASEPGKP